MELTQTVLLPHHVLYAATEPEPILLFFLGDERRDNDPPFPAAHKAAAMATSSSDNLPLLRQRRSNQKLFLQWDFAATETQCLLRLPLRLRRGSALLLFPCALRSLEPGFSPSSFFLCCAPNLRTKNALRFSPSPGNNNNKNLTIFRSPSISMINFRNQKKPTEIVSLSFSFSTICVAHRDPSRSPTTRSRKCYLNFEI